LSFRHLLVKISGFNHQGVDISSGWSVSLHNFQESSHDWEIELSLFLSDAVRCKVTESRVEGLLVELLVPLVELLVLVVELLGKLLVLLVRTSNGSSKALLVLAVEISVSLGSQWILAVSEFKQRHWLIRDFKSITTIPWRIVELGSCAGSRCQEKCCCELKNKNVYENMISIKSDFKIINFLGITV